MNPHEQTIKLLEELGVENPREDLAEKLEDHFALVIAEIVLRRAPENRLAEIKEKLAGSSDDLELLVADIASSIPGLAEEIEQAVKREYEVLKKLCQNTIL